MVADAAIKMGFEIIGYTDIIKKQKNPLNLKYLGKESDLDVNLFLKANFFTCIGDNLIRSKISDFIRSKSSFITNIIHPDSSVFDDINLGSGIFISKNAAVNSLSEIGDDVIINTSATVDHECKILKGAHIAPGSVLLGNVRVGRNSFIGANSVIKEGVKIGDNVIVGAGSVVLKDVRDSSITYGNPAKLI